MAARPPETNILRLPLRSPRLKRKQIRSTTGGGRWAGITYLPPPPARTPRQTRVEAGLEHATLDACAEQESKDRKQEERHNELIARRVSLYTCAVGVATREVSDRHEVRVGTKRTEATSLNVALLAGRRVGVGVAQGRACALRQVLVMTPLFCARETWFTRVIGNIHAEDSVVRAETYT